MLPALIVFAYLAVILYVGVFRYWGRDTGVEGYFLAGRSLGSFVFLASLFGTNMTAFAILGSSGHAFNNGFVTYGLMASSQPFLDVNHPHGVLPVVRRKHLNLSSKLWKIKPRNQFDFPTWA